VDDRDKELSWRGQWTKIDDEKENYRATAKSTCEKGASVEYTFEGEAVRLLVKSAMEYRKADIYIDGSYHKTVDMTGGYGRYITVRQYPVYVNMTLEAGRHTIKVINKEDKTIAVDGFEYFSGESF